MKMDLLLGIVEQIFNQRGNEQNDNNPDSDLHGLALK